MKGALYNRYAWRFVFCLLMLAGTGPVFSQATIQYCVRLTAAVQESPPRITLKWPVDSAGATSYTISRKAKSATGWGAVLETLPANSTSFTDSLVSTDTAYEYKVRKNGSPAGEGYILAGIRSPAIEYRGKLLLVVDSLLRDSLAMELDRLMKDISGDGWAVERLDVSTTDKDTFIKQQIKQRYEADSTNLKAVLLLGHIAVPYAGLINPDGHSDHRGAWPADIYYGNMHMRFTDVNVNDSAASRAANRNVAGDGKWDQSQQNSFNKAELQVSRIDLTQMPNFGKTEVELMRTYLDKDHAYRVKTITVNARALIDDNFGGFSGEAFAISGWRNFYPILGDSSVTAADYITTLNTQNYQWSYGCGGGSYTSAGGIGSTSNFGGKRVQSIFTMLFGSYFGDWDNTYNFLRAPLCADEPALTSCWAGRPHWAFHHMALGEHIGYSTRLTQNLSGSTLYQTNYGAGFVHVALMGDLTLRQHIIAPPAIIALSDTNENVTLHWSASADSVMGYYVYRSNELFGKYERLSPDIVAADSFTDIGAGPGLKYYMVKAVRLENTPSGTYYNLSNGMADTITVRDTIMPLITSVSRLHGSGLEISLSPNPASDNIRLAFNDPAPGEYSVEIFDATGRRVFSQLYAAIERQVSLPLYALAGGMYLCKITCGAETVSSRFEVVKH